MAVSAIPARSSRLGTVLALYYVEEVTRAVYCSGSEMAGKSVTHGVLLPEQ
jgi:hypothetical protein